jgi:hypothetical protein
MSTRRDALRRKTVFVLLGAMLVLSAVVAGPAIAAAGQKAHTSGGGKTALGKFQVSAVAEEEGVLGGASGQVGYTGTTFDFGAPVDAKLDVVCMVNTVLATTTTSFIETQDSATGLFYDVYINDNGPANSSPADQFALGGPYATPICGGLGPFLGFDVTSGNLTVNDATP